MRTRLLNLVLLPGQPVEGQPWKVAFHNRRVERDIGGFPLRHYPQNRSGDVAQVVAHFFAF